MPVRELPIFWKENAMNKKVLFFSSVEWSWMKQRPHFLAEELAKAGCEVTYLAINPHGSCDEEIASRLRVCEITKVCGYMRTPLMRMLAKMKIAHCLRKQQFDIVIVTNPVQLEMLPQRIVKPAKLIYDCMDLIAAFYQGRKKKLVEKLEKVLCEKADGITVSSSTLKDFLIRHYAVPEEKCRLIYNALFPEDCEKAAKSPEIDGMKHPSMIYMGSIEQWLDLEVLSEFMEKNPQWHLYMVGNVKAVLQGVLRKIPNCQLVGKLDHLEALEYVNSADITLLPFRVGGLVDMVDPVKLYEYIAMEKPIVSSYWPALEHFRGKGNIVFYQGKEDFSEKVHSLWLNKKITCYDPERFVAENNWTKRANDLLEFIS